MDGAVDGRKKVTFGSGDGVREYVVPPQPVGYLNHTLGEKLSNLGDLSEGNIGDALMAQSYELLSVLIPGFMDEHEYRGYPSKDAMERGEYDRAHDPGVTVPQITDALEACALVNGGKVAGYLKGLLQGETMERFLMQALAIYLEGNSSGSQSSQSPNGVSASRDSGAIAPTAVD